jgi:hypothetical protein
MKGFVEHYKRHVEITISNEGDFILQMSLEWKEKSLYISQDRQIERLIEKYNLKES